MGIFSKDNNVKKDPYIAYKEEINEFLFEGEIIENIYPLFIDYLCLTNKRIIFVNKNISLKEPKTTIVSTPYKNIVTVELEKKITGLSDTLSIITKKEEYKLKFIKGFNVVEAYNRLSEKII